MDINVVAFTGRLTADPTTRLTQTGKTVASFTVAVSGFKKEDVHFIDVSWWPAKPEHVSYFQKGNRVSISGSLKQERWSGQDGKQHSKIAINAQSVVSMEKRPDAAAQQQGFGQPQQQGFGTQPQQGFGQAQQPAPQAQQYSAPAPAQSGPNHFSDEDIPF